MKVCIVAPQSIALVTGGVKTQVQQTTRYLSESGIETSFYNPWKNYTKDDIEFAHIFSAKPETLEIALILKSFDIKFVVSPVVFSNHQPGFIRASRKIEQASKKLFSGIWTDYSVVHKICSLSEGVLPNTSEEANLIRNGFGIPEEKIRVIHNGVEDRFLHATPELFFKQYGFKDFILYVGNLGAERKNVLRLIHALKGIDRKAVLIGKAYDNDYGRQCLKEISANKNILWIDSLPHDSEILESAYAACEVFALPSLFETPGIAALEAGLAGAKVVITEKGGTKDYFHNAVYVDPQSVDSIRDGLQDALNAPITDDLKIHIKEKFLWPGIAGETANAYRHFFKTPRP